MLGTGLSQDHLFQIDEKKKYIGFLEESDEEKSHSEDDEYQKIEEIDDSPDQFLKKLASIQERVKAS